MYRWTVLFVALMFALIATVGCSGGGDSPVAPTADQGITEAVSHTGQTQTHLWGYWEVYMDLENMTVEAIPVRGATFAANVVQFMNGKPTALQFNIHSTNPVGDAMEVALTVSITHPLPGLPQYDGYDVRGIFCGDQSKTLEYGSGLRHGVPGTDQYMTNPDGYTRWYNAIEFQVPGLMGYLPGDFATRGYSPSASLNAYKYYANGLTAVADVWDFLNSTSGNGKFASGATNQRRYELNFPNTKGIKYGYAVVANWGGEDPGDHPSNAPECVGCDVTVTPGVYYESGTENGGDLILDISLFNWENQPDAIFVESPVIPGEYELTPPEMEPIGGDENYSTYHVEIPATEVNGLDPSWYWIICEEDGEDYRSEFTPSLPGAAPSATLAGFFRYELEILEEAPCASVSVTGIDLDPPNEMNQGGPDAYTGVEIYGSGFEGTNAVVQFQGTSANYDATNVVSNGDDIITCDIDLSGADLGFYDIYVENECGRDGTGEALLEIICPEQVYYTSFEASENESDNWQKTASQYWACHWFDGAIADSNISCSQYGYYNFYAWRTNGFTIPSCWEGNIVLTIQHMCTKQESYYDLSGVQYSTNGSNWVTLNFYDHPYVQTYGSYQYWEYSWSNRTSHAYLHTIADPGDTIWIRFDSASRDSIGNSAMGWTISEMTID